MLSGDGRFRTVFYAHEVATVRPLVEESPGRDVMFYNVLRRARETGGYVSDFFGSQSGYFKHALIRQAWRCDAVLAVGDWVVEELRFLGPEFARRRIDLVYNGVPAVEISLGQREISRRRLQQYAGRLLGYEPDLVFTHVTRLVPSKGLWRDLMVLERLDSLLEARGLRAVFIVLGTGAGWRSPDDVQRMAAEYGWPLLHREGYPDLIGYELDFDLQVRAFNVRSRAVKVLFVNQFGWDQASCGPLVPDDMEFADLRRGSDAEFGQSVYEPFGIALLEPLSFGSLSVVSDVCGCLGFVTRSAPEDFLCLVRGEYTLLAEDLDVWEARAIGAEVRARVEREVSRQVAAVMAERLPSTREQSQELLEQGHAVASRMCWERVVEEYFLPAMEGMGRG
jgi:glycosyltransferase involved in cell wall biosynthesis